MTVASYSSGAPAFPQRLQDLPYPWSIWSLLTTEPREYVPKAEPAVDPRDSGN